MSPSTHDHSIAVSGARATWLTVMTFAAGMAWVEAACVYYLRVLVDRVQPYQPNPLPIHGTLGEVELVREAATLVMLAAVGMLAGQRWTARFGYAAIAFGAWDILYYVFLRMMTGWPVSVFDWDILFLLPLPWWGPVLAPVCIASLMFVWGTVVTQWRPRAAATRSTQLSWAASAAGILLALWVFMADAIRVLPGGAEAIRQVLPTSFNWPAFGAALLLMAAPLVEVSRIPNRESWIADRNRDRNRDRDRDRDRDPDSRSRIRD